MRRLVLLPLGAALLCGSTTVSAAAAPTLTTNTTTVSGTRSAVRVSWTGLDLSVLRDHKTVWTEVAPSHPNEHTEPTQSVVTDPLVNPDAPIYWLAQFSPPVTSLDDVSFTGNPNLNVDGIATEGTAPFITPAPVKFISGTQLKKGYYDFVVTNMRQDVNWVLFHGPLDQLKITPHAAGAVALTAPVKMLHLSRPASVRLARTTKNHEMRVSWTSTADRKGKQHATWGLSPEKVTDFHAPAPTYTTYSASDLCGSPANSSGFHDPGTFFTTVFDLTAAGEAASVAARTAGLRVYYSVTDDDAGMAPPVAGWPVRSFLAPKPPNADTSLSILVTADMGETYEDGSQYHWEEPSAVNTTLQMRTMHPNADIVMHPGDLAYATGYESEWDRFMAQIEILSDSAPYMTGQGNHERDFANSGNSIGNGDSGGECGVPTQARFVNPTCKSPNVAPCLDRLGLTHRTHSAPRANAAETAPAFGPRSGPPDDGWYSFEQGPVHFLMLNTEQNSSNGSRQHTFVRNDLAAVDRSVTPWVLVFGHRQMYAYNQSLPANNMGDLEPLLLAGKADVAFWGHIHFAQSTCPMAYGNCTGTTGADASPDADGWAGGLIHTVIGNAGQSLTRISLPKADWTTYNASEWGWSHVTVSNASHLRMDFYADVPLGEVPPVHFSFDLHREPRQ